MPSQRHDSPVQLQSPWFDGATTWLNSEPLSPVDLQGRVVLVHFGTYTCINWIRSLPYVRAWALKYAEDGLQVVGVQTPEFAFEAALGDVERALNEMGVQYPVVVDNEYAVWQAFDNHYWPALYLVDPSGQIRHHHFGEGGYQESETVLQTLLRETGGNIDRGLLRIQPTGVEAAADWVHLGSPETYLGYQRATGFSFRGRVVRDESGVYAAPVRLRRNHWSLSGAWTIGSTAVALDRPGGTISYQFQARDLHLVMGPRTAHAPLRFRVCLNGEPPGQAAGIDIDPSGYGTADYRRMYQLIRQPGPIDERQFEIEFLDSDVEAFVFTFG